MKNMKKILKFVAFCLAFSMAFGVCTASRVYADDFNFEETPEDGGEGGFEEGGGDVAGDNTTTSTPIDLQNSDESVQTDQLTKDAGTAYFANDDNYDGTAAAPTNVWDNGTIVEEVKVTAVKTAEFTIEIPKEIVMDGETATADYEVNVVGDIAGDQSITVDPDDDFLLSEAGGKADVTCTVTQADVTFTSPEIAVVDGKTVEGSLAAPDLTAGDWAGKFNFTITYQ